jgi:hypothetical protein
MRLLFRFPFEAAFFVVAHFMIGALAVSGGETQPRATNACAYSTDGSVRSTATEHCILYRHSYITTAASATVAAAATLVRRRASVSTSLDERTLITARRRTVVTDGSLFIRRLNRVSRTRGCTATSVAQSENRTPRERTSDRPVDVSPSVASITGRKSVSTRFYPSITALS